MINTLVSLMRGASPVGAVDKATAVQQFIMHEVADSHELNPFPYVQVHFPRLVSVHSAMVLLAALLLVITLGVACRKPKAVPTGLANLVEAFVQFIRDDIAIPFLGREDGVRMTPLFCTFFAFILAMNLMGLVPCLATATANVNVTGALAATTLCFMIFGAIYRHGIIGFFKGFAPAGVPWPILILLVPVEIVSMFIKAFALMIRLFANELSGHIVVFSLLGLIVTFGYVALPSVAMAVGVGLLEVFVAFLQAYIFTLLSALFIGERYHPAH